MTGGGTQGLIGSRILLHAKDVLSFLAQREPLWNGRTYLRKSRLVLASEEEAKRIERGEPLPPENRLFDRTVFKAALPAVSKARLLQTVYAEYPNVEPLVSKLKGEKTEQTISSLAAIWKQPSEVAQAEADKLVEIGFFQKRGSRDSPTFWVPFLYRDALEMIQGRADEE
jgi:hypothetical protein